MAKLIDLDIFLCVLQKKFRLQLLVCNILFTDFAVQ